MRKSISVVGLLAGFAFGVLTGFADETETRVRPIQLNVAKDGRVLVLNQWLTIEQLKPVLTQFLKAIPADLRPGVELRIHPESRHGQTIDLIELCRELKFKRVRTTVLPATPIKDAIDQVESLGGKVHLNDVVVLQISFHQKKMATRN